MAPHLCVARAAGRIDLISRLLIHLLQDAAVRIGDLAAGSSGRTGGDGRTAPLVRAHCRPHSELVASHT